MAQFFNLNPISAANGRLSEAEQFYLAGNLNEGLAAAQQAWREYPQEPDVYRVLAYLHMARGEYPPAAQAAYRSVELEGNNPASYAILGQVYLTFGLMPQAEETLVKALQHFPNDAMLLAELADLRFRRRQDVAAVSTAQQALAVNPDDGYTSALLGMHHLKQKKYHVAAPYLRTAIRIYPFRPDYLRDFGIASYHVDDEIGGEWALRESLKHGPDDVVTRQYLYHLLLQKRGGDTLGKSLTLYFYNNTSFGWVLEIFGMIAVLIGIIVGLAAILSAEPSPAQWLWAGGLLFFGIVMIWLPITGIRLRGLRGKKLDGKLRQELSKADAGQ
ncbi:MAG: tetratricopeptide repeat protein [bacterium]